MAPFVVRDTESATSARTESARTESARTSISNRETDGDVHRLLGKPSKFTVSLFSWTANDSPEAENQLTTDAFNDVTLSPNCNVKPVN